MVAIGFNLLGDGLRDVLNPQRRERRSSSSVDVAGYTPRLRRRRHGPFDRARWTTCRSTVARGEVLGLVGESGSGKTSLAWAIMRYLPANAAEGAGSIRLSGEELRAADPAKIAATCAAGASAWCSRTPAPRSTPP